MRSMTHLEQVEIQLQQIINARRKRQYAEPPMWAVLLPIFLLIFAISIG